VIFRRTMEDAGVGWKQCGWGWWGLVGCAGWMQVWSRWVLVRNLQVWERCLIS